MFNTSSLILYTAPTDLYVRWTRIHVEPTSAMRGKQPSPSWEGKTLRVYEMSWKIIAIFRWSFDAFFGNGLCTNVCSPECTFIIIYHHTSNITFKFCNLHSLSVLHVQGMVDREPCSPTKLTPPGSWCLNMLSTLPLTVRSYNIDPTYQSEMEFLDC